MHQHLHLKRLEDIELLLSVILKQINFYYYIIIILVPLVHTEDIYTQRDERCILRRKLTQDFFQKLPTSEHSNCLIHCAVCLS